MGQSSTTCNNGDSDLNLIGDEEEHLSSRGKSGKRKDRMRSASSSPNNNHIGNNNTTSSELSSVIPQQSIIPVLDEKSKWSNDPSWRDDLINLAYSTKKQSTNSSVKIQLFDKVSASVVATAICPFLDIRSVIYLMQGTNREIYDQIRKSITHFFYIPMLPEEEEEEQLDDSYFPEDYQRPKQPPKQKPKILFPPKHANSSFWEPIVAQFPNLQQIRIPQLYILTHYFDLDGYLKTLKHLQNFNHTCLDHKYLKTFPSYSKITLNQDYTSLFESETFELMESYKHVHTLQLHCVKNVTNSMLNRLLQLFSNLKSLSITTCQFVSPGFSPSPQRPIVPYLKDPSCTIDFTGLITTHLEELSILCNRSIYDVNSIIQAAEQGKCPKLTRFRYSSTTNVVGAAQLEALLSNK
ncbi:hypothetical protein FDP41_007758 [Naegleria fowleri]|uniref:Uncharacterized protein n=1 Tax=Naegleria fowleri TaxID=5763 RepID=A0A6A5C091_NAEFO|nr:uncharacterized protein FDP41_007758 [Naegleria fowleri]KAF0983843.1 hypothetical protein FDP41_007758 [Naegleria fowleri]CAG4714070.1 unnamed protein product [Naegleria fowleri]